MLVGYLRQVIIGSNDTELTLYVTLRLSTLLSYLHSTSL